MTDLSHLSPGTESSTSVAGAGPSGGSDPQTVAALQSMLATMVASLAPASTPAAPIAAPAPAVPAAPAAVGIQTQGPWVAGAIYQVIPTGPLALIPGPTGEANPLWYCVTRGRFVGVTLSNSVALAAVSGISGNAMKSYKSQTLAVAAFNELLALNLVSVVG